MKASKHARSAGDTQKFLWYFGCASVASVVILYTIFGFCGDVSVRKVRVDSLSIIRIAFFKPIRSLLLISGGSVVVKIGVFGLNDFRNVTITFTEMGG